MNINKTKIGMWCEDKDGNVVPYEFSTVDLPKEAETIHIKWPLKIYEEIYMVHDYVDEDNVTRRTYKGSDKICTCCTHIGTGNEDVILAMANSGDYTLSEAIGVYANACERCTNVLAYKYLNGTGGYPEYSEEWKKCNTICDFCKGETE